MNSTLRIHRIAIPAVMALLVVSFQNCERKVALAGECSGPDAVSDVCLDVSASGAVLGFSPVRSLSDVYYERTGFTGPGGVASTTATIWFNHTERTIVVQSTVVLAPFDVSPSAGSLSILPPPSGDCERRYGAVEYRELTSALRAARIVANSGPFVSDGRDAYLTLRSPSGREARLPFVGTGYTSVAARGISGRDGDLNGILESYALQCSRHVPY